MQETQYMKDLLIINPDEFAGGGDITKPYHPPGSYNITSHAEKETKPDCTYVDGRNIHIPTQEDLKNEANKKEEPKPKNKIPNNIQKHFFFDGFPTTMMRKNATTDYWDIRKDLIQKEKEKICKEWGWEMPVIPDSPLDVERKRIERRRQQAYKGFSKNREVTYK